MNPLSLLFSEMAKVPRNGSDFSTMALKSFKECPHPPDHGSSCSHITAPKKPILGCAIPSSILVAAQELPPVRKACTANDASL